MEDNNSSPASIARKRWRILLHEKKREDNICNKENETGTPSPPALNENNVSRIRGTSPFTDIGNSLAHHRTTEHGMSSAPNKRKRFETSHVINLFPTLNEGEVLGTNNDASSSSTCSPPVVTTRNQGLTRCWPVWSQLHTPIITSLTFYNFFWLCRVLRYRKSCQAMSPL